MKRVAVLIPVYRNQHGLLRSLESLSRTDGAFDVVIVDDGSPERIWAPVQLRSNTPVRLLRLEVNQGIASALNHGLAHIMECNYSYVARLDAGDEVLPNRILRQQEFLFSQPNCAAVSSFVDFVDRSQTLLFRYRAPSEDADIRRRLHLNNCLVHSGSMLRASALRTVGLYREDLPGTEDYELFLRFAKQYTLAVLPEVLTRCEYSSVGLSVTGRRRQQRERLKLQLSYFNPALPHSFYGVIRTLFAMLAPHDWVFRFKRVYLR